MLGLILTDLTVFCSEKDRVNPAFESAFDVMTELPGLAWEGSSTYNLVGR